ncbi:MAG TPA: response regulator [Methylomirabilota bacterium]|jgi:phosphoribosyl 1,2-cyclic phosphodiesterase|nr:response regulator [Methylomirabilota bacterium]
MGGKLTVYVVDDSRTQAEITRALLEKAGHEAIISTASQEALARIPSVKPDCVLFDLMMPGLDGYDLCRRLRGIPELSHTRLVVVSSKAFPFERRRAFEMGADGYFVKPLAPATFTADLERLVAGTLTVSFWGVRGTLPVSRPDSRRYGGNTLCVSVDIPDGRLFVFDAGTGIRALSDALLAAGRTRLDARMLISHPHWDHINALPFFVPFYMQGNTFEICGPTHGDITMRGLISAQMDGVYFPITSREFAADVQYRDLAEGTYDIGGVAVRTVLLSHPGNCLGYRLEYAGRTLCYVTDNELYPADSPSRSEEYVERLVDFCRETDALITDCTYADDEYAKHVHWGHSSVSQVAELAWRARVRTLHLVHHDPGQSDADIDAKLAAAQAWLTAHGADTKVIAPVERAQMEL